jgi:hypothetical protein
MTTTYESTFFAVVFTDAPTHPLNGAKIYFNFTERKKSQREEVTFPSCGRWWGGGMEPKKLFGEANSIDLFQYLTLQVH